MENIEIIETMEIMETMQTMETIEILETMETVETIEIQETMETLQNVRTAADLRSTLNGSCSKMTPFPSVSTMSVFPLHRAHTIVECSQPPAIPLAIMHAAMQANRRENAGDKH